MSTLVLALQSTPWLLMTVAGLLGLIVGSFLNVVIYRWPIMLKREWRKECRDFLELEPEPEPTTFNLVSPPSHCRQCHTRLKPWQNIPVVSFLLQRGRCARCQARIAWRYPCVEILTAAATAFVAWKCGWALTLPALMIFSWLLLVLVFIDFDEQLLPDQLNYVLLWTGLLLNTQALFVPLDSAVLGAVAGYLSLWSFTQLFGLLTGKQGMGHGDFKLFAALGAWLGWSVLPFILVLASLLGSIVGIALLLRNKGKSLPFAFGPYLALAGWIAAFYGASLWQSYLELLGL